MESIRALFCYLLGIQLAPVTEAPAPRPQPSRRGHAAAEAFGRYLAGDLR
jgi:hypothetical protein